MTRKRLRLFDPRTMAKSDAAIRVARDNASVLDEIAAWLVELLWVNKEMRPEQWNGKLTRDEALRLVLRVFARDYGIPINPDKRSLECDDSDKPA